MRKKGPHRKAKGIKRHWCTVMGRCVYCGGPGNTKDHVLPKARGGGDHFGNMVPACRRCNLSKGHQTPDTYFRRHPHAAVRFCQFARHVDPALLVIADRYAAPQRLLDSKSKG